MTDIKSAEMRSRNMAAIHSKNTAPEVFIRKQLFARGYRYRINYAGLPGHPDIWIARYNTAVFINGCFWHRHKGCRIAYTPKSNIAFWQKKFAENVSRDKKVTAELKQKNIKCLIIWECTVRLMCHDQNKNTEVISKIEQFLKNDQMYEEL